MAKPTYPATLNSSDALASGLLGWWLLAEGTGTTAHDSSTTADDGTIASDVSWTTGDGADTVLSFPADTTTNLNVVDLGSSSTYVPSALTVAVRFRADSSFTATWQTVFGRGSVFVGFTYLLVFNGTTLRWYTTGGNWAGGTVSKDAWHTAVATWDGATNRLYIDGTELTAAAQSSALAGAFHLAIGRGSDGTAAAFSSPDGFGGLVSWAAIWNRVLSSTERSDVVSTPFRPFQATAVVRIPGPFPWLPAAVLAQ